MPSRFPRLANRKTLRIAIVSGLGLATTAGLIAWEGGAHASTSSATATATADVEAAFALSEDVFAASGCPPRATPNAGGLSRSSLASALGVPTLSDDLSARPRMSRVPWNFGDGW
jgi:hypothetical protein